MKDKKIVIAIDGFSSCGKSSMAKTLARKIGYIYIDSGAMYRAITLFALRQGLIQDNGIDTERLKACLDTISISFQQEESGKLITLLNGQNVESEIRSLEVSDKVSEISALPFVRAALLKQQRKIGATKGIVMDGRDIGTTVFPDAELKIFVTASVETRAQRRLLELQQKGDSVSYEAILENVRKRDFIDQNRVESPLRKADDALVLDNSTLSIEEQDAWLMNRFQEVLCRIQ